jgi:hypothetical protein
MKTLIQILRDVSYFNRISLLLFILISLVGCKTTSVTLYESSTVTPIYIKELPMDSVISMFQEDVLLVKTQNDFSYLITWYTDLVTKRLLFTKYEKSLFFYIIEEEALKRNYKL